MERAESLDDIDDWILSLGGGSTARQYAGEVRRFVARLQQPPLSTVTEDLVRYVSSLNGEATRGKAISALGSYFEHLHHHGRIAQNPARRLSRLVAGHNHVAQLFEDVRIACGERLAATLSWREVALELIGSEDSKSCLRKLDKARLSELLCQVQAIIARSAVEDVAARCEEPVFPAVRPSRNSAPNLDQRK